MKKILFIIIILGIIGFFGYNYYAGKNQNNEGLEEKVKSNFNVFETAIFHNAKFVEMREHKINSAVNLDNPNIGKKNPFQPEQVFTQVQAGINE